MTMISEAYCGRTENCCRLGERGPRSQSVKKMKKKLFWLEPSAAEQASAKKQASAVRQASAVHGLKKMDESVSSFARVSLR
jgi:hypothetical protein